MSNKKVISVGRTKARRIVGIDPKNMTRLQRDTMIGYHIADIRLAVAADMYGDVIMFANRIKLLAEFNEAEKTE
ncbi:hypothetical protein AH04_183 [Erwinia phage AH04]|uniref:Uncharacterized protein n=1 Tax=Erwinia phage AH04 TaxID=2869569 RepID=A0AAE7X133_9CAUD|nr:hypothetical protein PQC02_gp131 [Erwinia phage AH04]QZA70658.1 hypothetical protein AH04_183 [Erwinia phage AH04]